jgi:toxin HigB-1
VNSAAVLGDLAAPPGNRLEVLSGNLAGSHSIRINDQWRVVFRWTNAGPEDVEIMDYHK